MKYLYIHGLNGSSDSLVARQLKKVLKNDILVLDMPNNPVLWYDYITKHITPDIEVIIGNSTGGLFANYIAQRFHINTVLINPVTDTSDFMKFVGVNKNRSTGKEWDFSKEDVESLYKYEIHKLTSPTLIFLGKNDEVIDYTKTLDRFNCYSDIRVTNNSHLYHLTADDINEIKNMIYIVPPA